eukprot:symbB.v1.2.010125.t1/scaffold618.1/size180184/2
MAETVETYAPVEPAAAPAAAPTDTQEVADPHRDGEETPTPEVSHATTLALLQAEMDSVVKSMSDLVKVKEEDQITLYEPKDPESGEVDVAKEQLDVLVKIQHDLKRQQEVQRATLTSQFLLGKMQESMSKLLAERSSDFERQRKSMMEFMQKESSQRQYAMDQVESVVDKIGSTLGQFTSSLTTLSSTIKDLSADQRSQGTQHLDVLKGIHYEVQDSKKILDHIRANTLTTSKETKNLGWQVSELRSGSVDVSTQKGSLLYIISEDLKTAPQSTFDALAKSVKSVNETIEAGVNPEKHQEQQRVEDQKKEAERLQKEQEEQERQQVTMVIHPYTGQQMYLTGEQKDQFFRDLATMKPSDFGPVRTGSMGAGTPSIPGTPPIPSQGFPPRPPMGMGIGYGTPATPAGYGVLQHHRLLRHLAMFRPSLLRLLCLCFQSQLHLEGEMSGSL